MPSNPELNAWAVLAATGILLAFLVSLYTLIGRERKSPYLIKSVFSVFLVCIFGAVLDILSIISPFWNDELLHIGLMCLLVAAALTFWQVWTISIRLSQFVDIGLLTRFKNLVVRIPKRWLRQWRGRKIYEHNPAPLSGQLLSEVQKTVRDVAAAVEEVDSRATQSFQIRETMEPGSLAVRLRHHGQANKVLRDLAVAFLRDGHCMQYMTASRHPIEFTQYLKSAWPIGGMPWVEVARRVIAVDAYTPHFGFIDSINAVKTRLILSEIGVTCISSRETYAGMHSASSKAFNEIKRRQSGSVRQPILIIYEDCHALSDLESAEQYRVFVRHVLPSERLWGGMFTVFVETVQTESDWWLLQSYTSMKLDLRADWPLPEEKA